MAVHLNPEMEKKLDELAAQTGRRAGELVEDAMAGYLAVIANVRECSTGVMTISRPAESNRSMGRKPWRVLVREALTDVIGLHERLRIPPGSIRRSR